jgi:protein-tyrosine phosphatase
MAPIQEAAKDMGIVHTRLPIADFNSDDLFEQLPGVITRMYTAVKETPGLTYVHCNGGEFSPSQVPSGHVAY